MNIHTVLGIILGCVKPFSLKAQGEPVSMLGKYKVIFLKKLS